MKKNEEMINDVLQQMIKSIAKVQDLLTRSMIKDAQICFGHYDKNDEQCISCEFNEKCIEKRKDK